MATYQGICLKHGEVSRLSDLDCPTFYATCSLDRCTEWVDWKKKEETKMTEDTPNPLLVQPGKPVYDGYCPDHGRMYSNFQDEMDFPGLCCQHGCLETIEWKKQEEEETKEPTPNLHYLILRYNGGLTEVFKGEKQSILRLLALVLEVLRKTPLGSQAVLHVPQINLVLSLSGLHSVQIVDNEKEMDSLAFSGREGGGDPYFYPELKEEEKKETEDRSQETEVKEEKIEIEHFAPVFNAMTRTLTKLCVFLRFQCPFCKEPLKGCIDLPIEEIETQLRVAKE